MELRLVNPVNYIRSLPTEGKLYYISFTKPYLDLAFNVKAEKVFDAVSYIVGLKYSDSKVILINPYNLSSISEHSGEIEKESTIILDSLTTLQFYSNEQEIIDFLSYLENLAKEKNGRLIVLSFTKDGLFERVAELFK